MIDLDAIRARCAAATGCTSWTEFEWRCVIDRLYLLAEVDRLRASASRNLDEKILADESDARAEVERLRAALAEERKACDEARSVIRRNEDGGHFARRALMEWCRAHDARRAAEQRGPTWLDRLNSDYGAVRGENGDTIPPRAKNRAAEEGKKP